MSLNFSLPTQASFPLVLFLIETSSLWRLSDCAFSALYLNILYLDLNILPGYSHLLEFSSHTDGVAGGLVGPMFLTQDSSHQQS